MTMTQTEQRSHGQVDPVVVPVPSFERDGVTLYHADCLDVLPFLSGIDAVITDPPYGVGFKYSSYDDTEKMFFDVVLPAITMCKALAAITICCMSTKRLFDMPRPKGFVFWAHPGSTRRNTFGGFSECEPILVYGQWKLPNDYKYLPDCTNHAKFKVDHPCPKPERLMAWLVSGTKGESVLDPFMGSGTTGIACIRSGRKFIGIEKDAKYFEIAKNRIIKELQQGRLW